MTDSTTGDLERRVADAIRHKRSWPAEDVARAALKAHAEWLSQNGLAIVPKLPTKKMIGAAAKSMSPSHRPTPGRVSSNAKHGIRYQAMITAAQQEDQHHD